MQPRPLWACFLLCFFSATVLLCGCNSGGTSEEDEVTPRHLKSGKTIEVLYSQEESFGQKDKVLMFSYRTRLKIDDLPSLKKEAEEIWETIQPEADSEAYQRVIILPHEHIPQNIGDRSGQFRFVYVKSGDQWKME